MGFLRGAPCGAGVGPPRRPPGRGWSASRPQWIASRGLRRTERFSRASARGSAPRLLPLGARHAPSAGSGCAGSPPGARPATPAVGLWRQRGG
eukprot:5169009-Alexandrium_andersonii.AAC.1